MEQFHFVEIRSASIHSLAISLTLCVKPASLTASKWRSLQERTQAVRIVSKRLARSVGISSLGLEPSPAKKKKKDHKTFILQQGNEHCIEHFDNSGTVPNWSRVQQRLPRFLFFFPKCGFSKPFIYISY